MSVDTVRHDAVLLVTLNRPEAGNALDPETGQGICDAFAQATADDEVRAIVVTGAGPKIFCAGMDLKAFAAGADMAPVGRGLDALDSCPKPVIAAVNGMALAGGFEVAMRCDLIVAADHARFGIPEVKRGLVAAGGGTRLPSRIPLAIALEMGLTGDPIDAARAAQLGIVNRVVPAAEVLGAALELAGRITANGPLAVQATKRLMYDEVGPGDPKHVATTVAPVFASEDAKEGATAFAEKRPPVWRGR
ncbi:MAG: enoyl-CoA hydratase-related protein [Ilumatobacteraceae bacterium]